MKNFPQCCDPHSQRLCYCCCQVTSVVSNPQWPHGPQPSRLLRPWDFPAKSTGVGCHCLLCKSFDIVNKADVFLELSCFFNDPTDVGNMISGSSAFSKSSLNIWKFMVHVLLKSGLENLKHYFASVWDECNCVVLWAFFGIAFLWDWNANWPFPVLWPLLSCPNLLTLIVALSQHHLLGFEIAQLEFHHLH